jgi:hypothetical protein
LLDWALLLFLLFRHCSDIVTKKLESSIMLRGDIQYINIPCYKVLGVYTILIRIDILIVDGFRLRGLLHFLLVSKKFYTRKPDYTHLKHPEQRLLYKELPKNSQHSTQRTGSESAVALLLGIALSWKLLFI